MEGIAAEVSQKLKSAIKAKLMELGAYVDDELSNYVMVMVTNRRSKAEMDRELQLFLGANTSAFTSWLQSVWMKLEQVTVTNSGIDNTKRKKKIKRGLKSSSESDDDKKPKKKRKASASDLTGKEVKKKKSTKGTSAAVTKSELFSEENLSDTDSKSAPATAKKTKNPSSSIDEDDFLSIKEDFESEFLSDNETFEAPAKPAKPAPAEPTVSKKSSLQKSDLNEKIAVQPPADKKPLAGRHTKEAAETTKEAPVIRRIAPPENAKAVSNLSKIVLKNLSSNNEFKTNEAVSTATTTTRKALIRDRKLRSRSRSKTPTKNLRSKSRSPTAAPPPKTNRQRSRSRLRSRSPSPSPPRAVKRARGAARDSGSPPRSQSATRKGSLSTIVLKSRSRSPVSAYGGIADKSSAVVDARELINRKRAMVNASEQKDEKGFAKRQLLVRKHEIVDVEEVGGKQRSAISRLKPPTERLKGRERLKENANVENSEEVEDVEDDEDEDDDPDRHSDRESGNERVNHNSRAGSDRDDDDHDDDAYFDKDAKKKKFGRFVVSQQGGTRSVTMRSALEKKASSAAAGKNEKADLRNLRRTVYSDENTENAASDEHPEDDDVNEDDDELKNSKDDKMKMRKSVMNQIVKYIKDDSQGSTSSGKIVKINRPKIGNVPAASSTLIRKAMADAHKSMSSTKEESSKRKDQYDNNAVNSNSRSSEERTMMVENDPSDSGEQIMTDENRASSEETVMEADMEYDPEDPMNHSRDTDTAMESIEEYDPSKNVPQFVVTLTGLDPKLFPNEDIEMGDIDPMMDDIRLKPRSQERCKYYPNCLAGSQCLYYHPVIPCKTFPNCKYGNNCLYIHPKCKYDSSCTRYDCTYLHTSPRILPPAPARPHVAAAGMNQPCKYYYNCTNPVCPYLHPKLCRYDRYCTNKNCTFSHTSLIHVGGQGGGPSSQYNFSKLKWCRPKDANNENKNGSNDAKTEIDAAVEN